MAVRIITYDLNKERKARNDYEGFYQFIKKHSYIQLSESSYAIDTNLHPKDIYNALKPYIDANDNVLVLRLTSPWYGQHKKETNTWIQQRIPLG